jgi:flagellar motor switch protein FliG
LLSERTEKLFLKDSSELLLSVSSWLDDVAKVNDRTIQRVLREVDASIPAVALKDAKK